MATARTAWLVARKDLRVEWRSRVACSRTSDGTSPWSMPTNLSIG